MKHTVVISISFNWAVSCILHVHYQFLKNLLSLNKLNIVLFIKLRDEQALYLMLIMNNFF